MTVPPRLREAKQIALKRLHRLETKLGKWEDFRNEHNAAMQDHLDSIHMTKVPPEKHEIELFYCTPRQAVI